MLDKVHFIFIGEGSSDNGLINHLENLCLLCGASEATGVPLDYALIPEDLLKDKTVKSKVECALSLEPNANLIYVHRDSDSRNSSPRYEEINRALKQLEHPRKHVAVVPVQETEAWLLADPQAIRDKAGNPNGAMQLNIPKLSRIEQLANPKESLFQALVDASDLSGRRLDKFKQSFGKIRFSLLSELSPSGKVSSLPSWQRLKEDTENAIGSDE